MLNFKDEEELDEIKAEGKRLKEFNEGLKRIINWINKKDDKE